MRAEEKHAGCGDYDAPDQRDARLNALALACRGEVVELGQSRQGRSILAARIPGTRPDLPKILCSANIHGVEFIAARLALAFADAIAHDFGSIAGLRERAEIWIVPSINPDGYARTWAQGGVGSLDELRTNAAGVDLNRNYPLPHGARPRPLPGAGVSRPGAATYRGPAPLSEPETAAIDRLCRDMQFHASANLHSFMGTMIPARVTDRNSFATYCRLHRAFTRAQTTPYLRLSHRVFDVFTGEQEDHQHHVYACWAVCVETFPWHASLRQHLRAPSLFWRFNPRDPLRWLQNDVPALAAYFHAALDQVAPHR